MLVQNKQAQNIPGEDARCTDAAGMQVSWRGFIQVFAGESGKGADLSWLLLMPEFLL